MKNSILLLAVLLTIVFFCCKNDSDNPTTSGNPTVTDTVWKMIFHDYNIGSFYCTFPNPCNADYITDSLDFRNSDSLRVRLVYHSYHNNSLEVMKFPFYSDLFTYTFRNLTAGKIDSVFVSYKSKVIFDFAFMIGDSLKFDTLQIFKK